VLRVEVRRHQHRGAVVERPLLELDGGDAKHGSGAVQRHGVDPQRIAQVVPHLAEHLVGLDHLHRGARPVQAQRLAQLAHHAHVDAGLEAAAEVHGQAIGLAVGAGGGNAFA
jgi:hypothetical protein